MNSKIKVFAYGSNMWSARMVRRVSSAQFWSIGKLENMGLRFNKIGSSDGTGKANIVEQPNNRVYGVVYQVGHHDLKILDSFEKGYERMEFGVLDDFGNLIFTQAYTSNLIDSNLKPTQEYKDFVIGDALEHQLPICYVHRLKKTDIQSVS